MTTAARWPLTLALLLALSGGALGQARTGGVEHQEGQPTLGQVVRQTGAQDNPALVEAPPAQADRRVYLLTGILMGSDGATALVKLGEHYWAYRTTDATRESLVGLRPGDTIAVVGTWVEMPSMTLPDGKTAPTVLLDALYVTNDESQIPGAG